MKAPAVPVCRMRPAPQFLSWGDRWGLTVKTPGVGRRLPPTAPPSRPLDQIPADPTSPEAHK